MKRQSEYETGETVWLVLPDELARSLDLSIREMVARDYGVEVDASEPVRLARATIVAHINADTATGAATTAVMLAFMSAAGFPAFTDYVKHLSEAGPGEPFWLTLEEREEQLLAAEREKAGG